MRNWRYSRPDFGASSLGSLPWTCPELPEEYIRRCGTRVTSLPSLSAAGGKTREGVRVFESLCRTEVPIEIRMMIHLK